MTARGEAGRPPGTTTPAVDVAAPLPDGGAAREPRGQDVDTADALRELRVDAEALVEAALALAPPLSAAEVAERIVQHARRLGGTEQAALALVEDPTDALSLRFVATRGFPPPTPATLDELRPRHRRDGPLAVAVAERRPAWSADLAHDPALDLTPPTRAALDAHGLGASLAVPLLAADRVIAALCVYRKASEAFTARQVHGLQTLAALGAAALEGARRYEQADGRRRAAESLAEVGRLVSRSLDPDEVGRRIVESLRGLLGALSARLLRLDPESGALVTLASTLPPELGVALAYPPGTSVGALAIREGGPVMTPNLLTDPRVRLSPEHRATLQREPHRAVLAVPLVFKGQAVGAIAVGDREGRVFEPEAIRIAEAFADQAAVALENARLHRQTERRVAELATVQRVAQAINSALGRDELFRTIVTRIASAFGYRMASIYLRQGDVLVLQAQIGYETGLAHIPLGRGVCGRVVRTGVPALVLAADADPDFIAIQADVRQAVVVPLRTGAGEILGTLVVESTGEPPLADDDLVLLTLLADQVSVAVANARLYAETTRRQREAEALVRVARALTESLDTESIARRTVDSVRELLDVRSAAMRLRRPDGSLQIVATSGTPMPLFEIGHVLPPGTGIAGRAMARGRPAWTSDFQSEPELVLPEDLRHRLTATGNLALLAVPLVAREAVAGVVTVSDATGRAFSGGEIRLAQAFADQAALALDNARLHEAALRRAEELGALLRATRTVMSSHDLEPTLQRIVDEAAEIARAPHVALMLIDRASQTLHVAAATGEPAPPGFTVPMGGPYSGTVAATGEPRQVADVETDPDNPLRAYDRQRGIRSYLGIPIREASEILGVLTFVTGEPREYVADELAYLASFADQAAQALRRARLLQDAQTRQARLERLLELSLQISHIQPVDTVLRKIAKTCSHLLRADAVGFWLRDDDETLVSGAQWGPTLDPEPGGRLRIGESLSGRVAATGVPLVVDEPADDPRMAPAFQESARRLGMRAYFGVPVTVSGRVIGVLNCLARRPRAFTPDDVTLARAFAAQAAAAMENARLYQEARRAYEELSRTQEQLAQAQKMEAVGRLAGGVAHDFNNLLAVIMGYSELMVGAVRPPDPLHEAAEEIRKAAARAAALTRQLLTLSRRHVVEPKVVDLNALIQPLTAMLRRAIGEDVGFETRLDPTLGRARVDPGQVEQVIVNLAVNARDAMPQGGRLTLETANAALDPAAGARAGLRPGRYVMLRVADTGVGIAPEIQAHIFEPFFTTKEVAKGTGLGLATVYSIVTQGGGGIRVDSALGQGAAFTIYWPRVDSDGLAEATGETAERAEVSGGSETILLVEDEAGVRRLVRQVLEAVGYQVLEVGSGGEALARAGRHQGPIHLLLTDVVMPEMSGRELATRLAAVRPGTRVLYMTGYADDVIGRHGILGVHDAVIGKPFGREALARKVRQVLDGPPSP